MTATNGGGVSNGELNSSDELCTVVTRDEFGRQRLERAITAGCDLIAIEAAPMANEAARSIQLGNALHKTSVLTGLGFWPALWLDAPFERTLLPLCAASAGCCLLYDLFWQRDPLCKYQIDSHGDRMVDVPSDMIKDGTSYVLLIRRDDSARKVLQRTIALGVVAYCGLKLQRTFS